MGDGRDRRLGGRRTKAAAFLAVLLVSTVGGFVLAPAAGAHHAVVEAEVVCAGPDAYAIEFVARSWDTGPGGANNRIAAYYQVDDGAPVLVAEFSFPEIAPGGEIYSTGPLSADVTVPASAIDELRFWVVALDRWGDGGTRSGPWVDGGDASGVDPIPTIALADCQPAASSDWSCRAGADEPILVTLDNRSNDLDAVFDVNGASHELAAGEQEVVELDPPIEDGDPVEVVVRVGDVVLHSASYSADCEPSASSEWVCRAGSDEPVVVTLDNSDGVDVVVFEVNGAPEAVSAGQIETVELAPPVHGGPAVDVVVSVSGTVLHEASYAADCLPRATAAYCQSEGSTFDDPIVVTLDNTGIDTSTLFDVNGTVHEVGPDTTRSVEVASPPPPRGQRTVAVSVGGVVLLDETFTYGTRPPGTPSGVCVESDAGDPTASASWCTAGEGEPILVTLDNRDRTGVTTFVVNGISRDVAGGAMVTVEVPSPGQTGSAVPLVVTADERVLAQRTFSGDCGRARAEWCTVDRNDPTQPIRVQLDNSGNTTSATTFTVNGEPTVLEPGETQVVLLDPPAVPTLLPSVSPSKVPVVVAAGGEVVIDKVANGATGALADRQQSPDPGAGEGGGSDSPGGTCTEPALFQPSAASSCASNAVVVSLNNAASTETAHFSVDGEVTSLAAGQTTTFSVFTVSSAGEPRTVTVTAGVTPDAARSATQALHQATYRAGVGTCAVITGAPSRTLSIAGLALLGLGFILAGASRELRWSLR